MKNDPMKDLITQFKRIHDICTQTDSDACSKGECIFSRNGECAIAQVTESCPYEWEFKEN